MYYCKDLKEVRENIDRIDYDIIRLLAERSEFVEQAAIFKNNEAMIRDPNRIKAVLTNVRNHAVALGMDPTIVEHVYRVLLDEFIDYELKEYRRMIEDEIM